MENSLHKLKIFKSGFTLAEVLITLVIIGIVAALTIPTAINSMEKRHLIIGWRKAYSDVSRALLLAKANNDSFDGLGSTDLPAKLSKYMNGKICADDCIELENGTRITFAGSRGMGGVQVHFDVNGDRKPNISGKDKFCAILDRQNYKINPAKGFLSGWGCADDILFPAEWYTVCNDEAINNAYNIKTGYLALVCSSYYLMHDK